MVCPEAILGAASLLPWIPLWHTMWHFNYSRLSVLRCGDQCFYACVLAPVVPVVVSIEPEGVNSGGCGEKGVNRGWLAGLTDRDGATRSRLSLRQMKKKYLHAVRCDQRREATRHLSNRLLQSLSLSLCFKTLGHVFSLSKLFLDYAPLCISGYRHPTTRFIIAFSGRVTP